jgi:Flp pilus assembly protein CpaB
MINAKRKAFIFLSLAFILAVLTSGLVLNEIREAKRALGETVKVAIASKDIPNYTAITKEMVDWIQIPKSSELSSFVTDLSDLEKSVLVVSVKEGDLLTKNMLRDRVQIPADHRVVWLNVSKNVILDQEVAENDLVDIIATYEPDGKLETKRVLEQIPVIQVRTYEKEKKELGAIKVSIDVEQAEKLIHLQNTAQQIRVLRVSQIQEKPQMTEKQTPVENEPKNQDTPKEGDAAQ